MERRTKRSEDREEALQYLVEALADRSEVQAIVLVDGEGHIVAGMGMPKQVKGLADMAIPMVSGQETGLIESVTEDADFFGRKIPLKSGSMYLTALGTKVRKMHEAVYAISRIVEPSLVH
jgi:hypothetical protein